MTFQKFKHTGPSAQVSFWVTGIISQYNHNIRFGTTVFSSLFLGHNKLIQENREQNDYQMFGGPLYEAQQPDVENQTAAEVTDDYEHSRHAGHDHFERRGMLNIICNIPHRLCFDHTELANKLLNGTAEVNMKHQHAKLVNSSTL